MRTRLIIATAFLLALSGCHRNTVQPYEPSRSISYDPIPVIKSTIEKQPPTYATVPKRVDVTDEYIRLVLHESAWRGPLGIIAPIELTNDVETTIRYEHIGSVRLCKWDVWWVELRDPTDYYIYAIYSFREDRAKQLVDALTVMINRAR